VTVAAPVVQVQGTSQQASMTSELVSALPTGRSLVNLGILIPGMEAWSARSQNDVGGTNNLQNIFLAVHGGRPTDQRTYVDGIAIRNIQTEGHTSNFTPDASSTREVTIDYGAGGAEQPTGGVRANYVPRDGADRFETSLFATAADSRFQGNNISEALHRRGLADSDSLKLTYDVNPTGGGPIVRRKAWFYTASRFQSNQNYIAGVFDNRNAGNPDAWTYDPDFGSPGLFDITQGSASTRVTWQPNARNKMSVFFERQWRVWDEGNVNRSPEAFSRFRFPQNQIAVVGWSSPVSSRLMLDARGSYHAEEWRNIGADELLPNNRSLVPVLEQGGAFPGLMYRAKNGVYAEQAAPFIAIGQSSVSYVTGVHVLKAGFDLLTGTNTNPNTFNDSGLQYRFNNGVPNQITQFATPYDRSWTMTELALFAQDKWTLDRLTVNAGLRFDYYRTTFPAIVLGPGPLVPDRNIAFPETPFYRLKDLSPRLGAAYDLFGDGKTAVKASANRYVVALTPVTGHPVTNLASSATRSWADVNRNFIPDCDILNPLGNGECGILSDLSFGQVGPSTTFDPAMLAGWQVRPDNWEFSTGIQHELRPRIGINGAFIRRVYGNFIVQDNRATTASDYTPYAVTAPADSRLPGGGAYRIGGLYNLNPDKVGQVSNIVTFARNYGRQVEHWNGIDLGVSVRLRDVFVHGGFSSGRTSTDVCDLARQLPEILGTTFGGLGTRQTSWSLDHCHVGTRFVTQTKWFGRYVFPTAGIQVAATFQSGAGPELQANYVAPNALVEPALGRPLSGGAANTTVPLLEPGTFYGDRLNQLDLRLSKDFRYGQLRTRLNFDLYNALNANPVTALNINYSGTGVSWLQPQNVLPARLFKISVQLDL
jgi:hypothetical protein